MEFFGGRRKERERKLSPIIFYFIVRIETQELQLHVRNQSTSDCRPNYKMDYRPCCNTLCEMYQKTKEKKKRKIKCTPQEKKIRKRKREKKEREKRREKKGEREE